MFLVSCRIIMASDPALLKAKEKAKENFSFSEPENFFSDLPKGDLVAFARARDEWYHARIVEVEMIKIYRERLEKCYARDPVNHKQNCRKMALDYLAAWDNYRDNKSKAFIVIIASQSSFRNKIK